MKPLALCLLGLIAVAAPSVHIIAADGAAPAGISADQPAPTSGSGTISNVDSNSSKVSVRVKDGKSTQTLVLVVNAQTKITKDGKDATLADLKAGDNVKVGYITDANQTSTAATIDVSKAKGNGKKKK